MRSGWLWSAASLLLLPAASPLPAAVLERQITHTVRPGGSVREETRLVVRLDSEGERQQWTRHYIYLDDNRRLDLVKAEARQPDGKKVKVGRRDRDTLEVAGGPGVLHSSQRFEELTFPALPLGSVLTIEQAVEVEPYFPAGAVAVTAGEAVGAVAVEVRGTGIRWRLDGEDAGLTAAALAGGGVRLSGRDLPKPDPPEHAPGRLLQGPVLRYSWGAEEGWGEVGRWYDGLLAQLPPAPPEVGRLARELTADFATPAQRLAALTDFVQQKVRYVAVEVGIGGYRPSPPGETLERRWGDCKDKSLLLIQLLKEAGIGAWPALILASGNDRIDAQSPAPNQFNHLIVAVDAGALAGAGGPGGPEEAAAGYLFVDPTQTRGSAAWLNPGVQGQQALVVRDGGGALVEMPVVPRRERFVLNVVISVGEDGTGRGGAGLALEGAAADSLLDLIAIAGKARVEEEVRRIFTRLLPGVALGAISAVPGESPLPALSLSAAVELAASFPTAGEHRSFALPAYRLTPEPRHLTDRRAPVVLDPGRLEMRWKINLPLAGCAVEGKGEEVRNGVGSFAESASIDGGALSLVRTTEISRRWVELDEVAALSELALAEHRAARRRIRLQCPAASLP